MHIYNRVMCRLTNNYTHSNIETNIETLVPSPRHTQHSQQRPRQTAQTLGPTRAAQSGVLQPAPPRRLRSCRVANRRACSPRGGAPAAPTRRTRQPSGPGNRQNAELPGPASGMRMVTIMGGCWMDNALIWTALGLIWTALGQHNPG